MNSIHSCSHCAMSDLCLPLGVQKDELRQLEELVESSKPLHMGDVVFDQGEPFTKLYAVKSGLLKSTRLDEQGKQHIVSFHLPGELVGLDGIYPGHYTSSTTALGTSVMCEMDYTQLSELCTSIPSLQNQMFRLLSRDIYESNVHHAEQSEQTAEQKLASFLNNLSARYEARGYSARDFPLSMPRQDIANHLGLAPETVSRLIKRFRDEGILSIKAHQISLHKPETLKQVIGCG